MPGQRGFTRRNLFRMRQFYETYSADEKVTALVTQLPWTHNLIILTQSKRPEEREFYLRMAMQEKWNSRELERQYRLGAFERAVLSPPKVSAALTQLQGDAAASVFKDAYSVEFLSLATHHTEADLHGGLLGQQGQRGSGVRAQPHAVAGAGGAVPDPVAGQTDAGGQAA